MPLLSYAYGGAVKRNGYLYSISQPSATVVMDLYAIMYGRAMSKNTDPVWYCNDNYWMDNGLRVLLKDLDVSYDLSYGGAEILYATGQSLSTISKFQVPGLQKVVLGTDGTGVNGGIDCRVSANAFAGYSSNLETIILNKPIVSIGDKAFDGLKSGVIICHRETPPELSQNAFSEIAYENVNLVVPDNSFTEYRNSTWGHFKNIIAENEVSLSFSNEDIQLYTGESAKLTFTKDVDFDELKWTTSKNDIVEVSNGIITAKKVGKATVTATNKYGFDASCSVEVFQGVTSIRVNDSQDVKNGCLLLYTGTPYNIDNIDVYITPEDAFDKTLLWEIEDENVATISNGVINPNFEGETPIEIKSKSGVSTTLLLKVLVDKFTYNGLNFQAINNGRACQVIASNASGIVAIPDTAYFGSNCYEVKAIGKSAFSGCDKLVSVDIPSSITSTCYGAFRNCSNLENITIPKSVKYISDYVFDGCSSLVSVILPDSIHSIGKYIFSGCSSLASIKIPNTVSTIEDYAFSGCSALTMLRIPSSVYKIGDGVFQKCKSIKELIIDDDKGTLSLGIQRENEYYANGLFNDCQLEKVYIGRNLSYKYKLTPFKYSSVAQIVIGDYVTTIEESEFYNCFKLKSIEIGDALRYIKRKSFYGCYSLCELKIKALIPPLVDEQAFDESAYDRVILYVPKESITDYNNASVWKDFNHIRALGEIPAESVKLSVSSLTLNVNEQYSLIVAIFPETTTDKSVTFESSDPEIANVDENGNVTAHSPGVAKITIASNSNPDVKATLDVIVTAPLALSIELEPSSVEAIVGNEIQLIATILPEFASQQDLEWSSSDSEVASVSSSGLVKILKEGTAVIDVHTTDGSDLIATCNVSGMSSIESLLADVDTGSVDIYNLQGICIKTNASLSDIKALSHGFYIISGRKVLIK